MSTYILSRVHSSCLIIASHGVVCWFIPGRSSIHSGSGVFVFSFSFSLPSHLRETRNRSTLLGNYMPPSCTLMRWLAAAWPVYVQTYYGTFSWYNAHQLPFSSDVASPLGVCTYSHMYQATQLPRYSPLAPRVH